MKMKEVSFRLTAFLLCQEGKQLFKNWDQRTRET